MFHCFVLALAGLTQAQTLDPARTAWGFDRSDLAPHPGVRFGVLSNGMRYALMRNPVPAGVLSARLRIAAGSTVQSPREQGFMHVLEHLIFTGSANLPKGALSTMLPHQGLKRWTDFNAFTSFNETVYRLDLTKSDRRARDTVLTLMREISTNLIFERRTVEDAKTTITQEIRARDAVQDRIRSAQENFFMPGTPLTRGSVAGTEASVRRARGASLRRLYERYYVPGRTTLVLVGDFDPAAAEADIVARFSDWRPRAEVGADPPAPSIRTDRSAEARLLVDAAAPTSIAVAVAKPLGGADAAARRDAVYLEHLGAEMLDRRLARIAAAPDAPFASASAAIYDHAATARLARIDVTAQNRDWRGALQAGARELADALEHGFSQAELDAQLAADGRALTADAAPRTSPALADAIVDAVERRIVFTEPADPRASIAYLARVRLADVNAAFKTAWASSGRLIFVSHNRRISDGKAAILAGWNDGGRATDPRPAGAGPERHPASPW